MKTDLKQADVADNALQPRPLDTLDWESERKDSLGQQNNRHEDASSAPSFPHSLQLICPRKTRYLGTSS
jgi:hypothetical protein